MLVVETQYQNVPSAVLSRATTLAQRGSCVMSGEMIFTMLRSKWVWAQCLRRYRAAHSESCFRIDILRDVVGARRRQAGRFAGLISIACDAAFHAVTSDLERSPCACDGGTLELTGRGTKVQWVRVNLISRCGRFETGNSTARFGVRESAWTDTIDESQRSTNLMSPLTLQASATSEVAGLIKLYVLVCDREGGLVAGLPGEAFSCVALAVSGHPDLLREGFVEACPGCYRLALNYEPQAPIDMLTVSVRQRVRTNPIGLAPVRGTVAQGHVLVALKAAVDI